MRRASHFVLATAATVLLPLHAPLLAQESAAPGGLSLDELTQPAEVETLQVEQAVVPRAGECVESDQSLCLNHGRYRVQVGWEDFSGKTGAGTTYPMTEDSGLFWFFNPNNLEMLVKVLDGCPVNGRVWVFFAATTNVGYEVQVTDTVSGQQKTYRNAVGNPSPAITDTLAFDTCG